MNGHEDARLGGHPAGRALALLAACAALAGCPQPVVMEVRLVADTDATSGGHQVQALVRDTTGVTRVEVLYTGQVPGAVDADTPAARDMVREDQEPTRVDTYERWRGSIGGYPVGTTVRYAVRACNRLNRCVTEPAGWPETEALAFVVGRLPSRPFITQVTPPRGPTVGGLRVELQGEDFRPGMTAEVGGRACGFTEVLSTTEAACILPPGDVGPADVTVRNPDDGLGTLRDGFTYFATPIPLRVVPPQGPTAGGTPVRVEGRDFVPGARVTFEGRYARGVVVVDAGLILCETPPGNAGFADVTVEHPEGGAGLLRDGYRYVPPPRVDGVLPPEGPDFGGQVVTVVGADFLPGATVRVGGQDCVDVVFVSATELQCTVPAGTPGSADVEVTNPDTQSGALPGGYYYNGPPLVLGMDPAEGPLPEGAEATVLGAGFLPGATVRVDGVPAQVVGPGGSRDRITILVPAAQEPLFPAPDSGTRVVDVEVENPPPDGRSATGQDMYTYVWPPEVAMVVPGQGPTRGGTPVRITGRFFRTVRGQPLATSLDGAACVDLAVVSSTELACVTPPGDPGPADVAVKQFDAPLQEGVGAGAYLYIPPPRVDAVTPPDGPVFGGDTVTVRGAFFQAGATVTFDGAPCVNVVVSMDGTSLTCTVPPGEHGPADVTVRNPDDQEDTLERGYTYLRVSVSPDGGFEVGFTRVRLRAAGMQPGVQVFFGTVPATLVTRVSDRELLVQSPPGALGTVDVRFRNPDGTGDVAEQAFEYRTLADRSAGSGLQMSFSFGNDAEVADLDGDGIPDVAVANGEVGGPQSSVVYLARRQNGGVRFDVRVLPESNLVGNQVSLGDVDGDGDRDLLIAASERTELYVNDGTATYARRGLPNAGDGAFDAALVDLTGDGRLDIFSLNIGCSNFENQECNPQDTGRDTFLVNMGNLNWEDRSNLVPHDAAQVHDHKFELLDVDGNGTPDLVVNVDNKNFRGAAGPPRHRVLINNFPAPFEERSPPDLRNIVGDVYGIAVGDLDGDGQGDVVQPSFVPSVPGMFGAGTPGSTILLMGRAGGDFVRDDNRGIPVLDEPTINVALEDMDADGDLEVFSINLGGIMRMWVNRGDGTFVDGVGAVPAQVLDAADVAPADYDGDGDLDLVVITHGTDALWLAQPQR